MTPLFKESPTSLAQRVGQKNPAWNEALTDPEVDVSISIYREKEYVGKGALKNTHTHTAKKREKEVETYYSIKQERFVSASDMAGSELAGFVEGMANSW